MTHRHDGDPAPEPGRPADTGREEKTFLQLIPRRDITKVALLVVLLVVVVALQRRSGAIIRSLTRGLTQPPPAQVAPKEPPRVRLAPPQP
jgi:hypothetical protein